MMRNLKMRKSVIILFLLYFCLDHLFALKIKKIDEVELNQKETIIERGCYISVTEDNTLILADIKAKNIKLYDSAGKFLKILIKQGFGPNEVAYPSKIDYKNKTLALIDVGKRRHCIYKNSAGNKFESVKEIVAYAVGNDVKLVGNKIFIAGYKTDKEMNAFGLYSTDLKTDETDFLIPYHKLYGYDSFKAFIAQVDNLNPIGRACFLDVDENFAYIIWEGKLELISIDLRMRKITTFSKKTKNYIAPELTKKMSREYIKLSKDYFLEVQKFSYIIGIFIDNSFVAVLYSNYNKAVPGWETFAQFYTRKGNFLHEEKLGGAVVNDDFAIKTFFYDRGRNILYFLSRTIDKELNDIYKLVKYRIEE